ncbi:MAG: HypC/HybG/HupF family hydrogenase formation chaperone [Betaproteobacteria bacterium]|nr:HypC/HybG/HupF family hydrogenase formation chaperone [Betaproteobacteria bacterium]
MCLALPMQVIRMEGSTALCEGRNGVERVDTLITGPLQSGQWILSFLGAAREVVDAGRAAQVEEALTALESILNGTGSVDAMIHAGFADLIDREPQLPEFLRPDPLRSLQ